MMLFPLFKFTNSRFLTRVFLRIEIDHPFLMECIHYGRDLRFNKLSGPIPDSFQDFTLLQFL